MPHVVTQLNPLHTLAAILFLGSTLILHSKLCLILPSGVFLSEFLTKILYAFLAAPLLATYNSHLIFLHVMILIKQVGPKVS